MVERPSCWFAFLLPDEIGAHCDFIFGCFRTRVIHLFFDARNQTISSAEAGFQFPAFKSDYREPCWVFRRSAFECKVTKKTKANH